MTTKKILDLTKTSQPIECECLGTWVYKPIEGEYWNDYTIHFSKRDNALILSKDTTVFKEGTTEVIKPRHNRVIRKYFLGLGFDRKKNILAAVKRCKQIATVGE